MVVAMDKPRPAIPPVTVHQRGLAGPYSAWNAGETMESLLKEAMRHRERLVAARDYSAYEQRAIRYMTRHRALIPEELEDVRFFQCRACGFNPGFQTGDKQTPIRKWFWAKSEETRKDLVTLSRALRVKFFRGKRNVASVDWYQEA